MRLQSRGAQKYRGSDSAGFELALSEYCSGLLLLLAFYAFSAGLSWRSFGTAVLNSVLLEVARRQSARAGSGEHHEGACIPPGSQSHVCPPSHVKRRLQSLNHKHSKALQFSLLNNQDTVKLAEFEVTHRDLYTPIDRLPVKNGVLDRRLVRTLHA